MRRVLTVVGGLALLYLLVCAAAFLLQERMLFPAPPARALPAGAERLALTAPDGIALAGIHFAPSAPAPGAPLILSFAGNATNADHGAALLHDIFPEAEVVGFHYRGYPPSGGRPSARALQADSLAAYDYAVRRFPGRPVVAVGASLGTGVACHLAAHRRLDGLILVMPFDSLSSVAAAALPFLPVRLLFRNPMDSVSAIRTTRVPTAIVAAGGDTLVRPARTAALRAAAPNLVYDRTIPGAGHNDIYGLPAFHAAMREALAKVGGA